MNVRVLYDESLAPGEVVLAFREVGAQKQRQLQERKLLEDALDLARSNEASKQAFFRNMSHDMRTPLNAILSLSALAEQHAGDLEKVRGYLKERSAPRASTCWGSSTTFWTCPGWSRGRSSWTPAVSI